MDRDNGRNEISGTGTMGGMRDQGQGQWEKWEIRDRDNGRNERHKQKEGGGIQGGRGGGFDDLLRSSHQ